MNTALILLAACGLLLLAVLAIALWPLPRTSPYYDGGKAQDLQPVHLTSVRRDDGVPSTSSTFDPGMTMVAASAVYSHNDCPSGSDSGSSSSDGGSCGGGE